MLGKPRKMKLLLLLLVIFREFPIFLRGTKVLDKADTIPPKQLI